jgi:hypothetical protein
VAFFPPFEVLFPLSDDVSKMQVPSLDSSCGCPMIFIPRDFLSVRVDDHEMPKETEH